MANKPIPFPSQPPQPNPDGYVYFVNPADGRKMRIRWTVEEVPPTPAEVVEIADKLKPSSESE